MCMGFHVACIISHPKANPTSGVIDAKWDYTWVSGKENTYGSFLKGGVPPVIIHVNGIFHDIKHPAIGYPHGTPQHVIM